MSETGSNPGSDIGADIDSDPTSNPGPAAEVALLFADLRAAPWRFGLFHTLRRLDCLHPRQPRLGCSLQAADDPVRLAQLPATIFAPAELAACEPGLANRPPRLLVYSLGLLGPDGPLPLHLTEYVRERQRHASDQTLARFLDIFHHRMLSLFYRAWAQAQPAVAFDRPAEDRFGTYVGTLSGHGLPAWQQRDAMPDLAKRHFAGLLAAQTRHADGLGAILSSLLGLPVRIRQFIGHWLQLPADCQLRLGESPETGSLGQTTTLGGRVWDHQNRFRIEIGPLALADYQRCLPGAPLLTLVRAVVRNWCGDALDWELNPILSEPEVPALRLGASARLGWTTWAHRGRLGHDGAELKLEPNRIAASVGAPPHPATPGAHP